LGEISTGAQNDLERASKTARKMVMEWGMSEKLGPLTFGRPNGEDLVFLGRDISRERNYSEEVAALIDQEVREIVESSYEKAKDLLMQHRDKLDLVAEALLERETLTREEFLALMEGLPLPAPQPEAQVPETVAAYQEEKKKETARVRSELRRPGPDPVVGEA
ncbi:MAG TPA: cell division protein FtsH, partial [Firmicutes bacterium]|nr:cell division protein FtsH [Bacillota bacterium]